MINLAGLTEDQMISYNEIVEFLHGDKIIYYLKGFAGTGKTFLINKVIQYIKENFNYDLCVTAPSHKAKQNIIGATGVEGLTIQKILGLKPNVNVEEFDINSPVFTQQRDADIQHYNVIFMDEYSMINSDLKDLIKQEAETHNVKIIFIGDHLQLAPIGELVPVEISEDSSTLTTSVRQGVGNPLNLYIKAVRADLLFELNKPYSNVLTEFTQNYEELFRLYPSIPFPDLQTIIAKPGSIFKTLLSKLPKLIIDGQGFEWVKNYHQFNSMLKTHFKITDRYLAFTNKEVGKSNKILRDNLMDNPVDNLVIGDLILSYITISAGEEDELLVMENSATYEITGLGPFEDNGFEGKIMTFKSVDGYDGYHRSVKVLNTKSYIGYLYYLARIYKLCKERGDWSYMDKARNRFCTMHNLQRYFKNNANVQRDVPKFAVPNRPSFDYAYALTVHKSQGSTYENIFVDGKNLKMVEAEWMKSTYTRMRNIGGTAVAEKIPLTQKQKHIQFLRLLYVAISRARNCVYIKF